MSCKTSQTSDMSAGMLEGVVIFLWHSFLKNPPTNTLLLSYSQIHHFVSFPKGDLVGI